MSRILFSQMISLCVWAQIIMQGTSKTYKSYKVCHYYITQIWQICTNDHSMHIECYVISITFHPKRVLSNYLNTIWHYYNIIIYQHQFLTIRREILCTLITRGARILIVCTVQELRKCWWCTRGMLRHCTRIMHYISTAYLLLLCTMSTVVHWCNRNVVIDWSSHCDMSVTTK